MLLERTGWRHILTCHVLGNWAWNMFWNRLSTWSRHMSSNYSIASWLLAIFQLGSRRWSYSFCLDWTISNGVLIGLPVCLVRRLQSVLNAAARMIVILPFLRRSDHITDALVNLHWLRVPKRIQYKIAMLTYEVLKGIAPPYLGPLVRAADLQTYGSTWSPFSQHYSSGRTAKQTFYDWQSNLWGYCCSDIEQSTGGRDDITNSISTFRSRLKTYLFRLSYPDLVF